LTDAQEDTSNGWRRCSTCKKWIVFTAAYVRCNVSTCNRKNTGLVFCSLPCWDAHLPTMNHRQAWAEDERAPTREAWKHEQAIVSDSPREPRRIVVKNVQPAGTSTTRHAEVPQEILIIASRLKNYIKMRSGMNTSDGVLEPLSDILRGICDEAIDEARRKERKTVLERDIPPRK
jgi:hypothetical protein